MAIPIPRPFRVIIPHAPRMSLNPRESTTVGALWQYAQRRHDIHPQNFRHQSPPKGSPAVASRTGHPVHMQENSTRCSVKQTFSTMIDYRLHTQRRAILRSETLYRRSRVGIEPR